MMVLYVGPISQVTGDWARLKVYGWPFWAAVADNVGGGAMECVLEYS